MVKVNCHSQFSSRKSLLIFQIFVYFILFYFAFFKLFKKLSSDLSTKIVLAANTTGSKLKAIKFQNTELIKAMLLYLWLEIIKEKANSGKWVSVMGALELLCFNLFR